MPKLGTGRRDAFSTNFTPPPRRCNTPNDISVDLQRFRLYTGAPIFVDFKSIPYQDQEVIDWWGRVGLAEELYRQPDWSAAGVRRVLAAARITHVVAPAHKPLPGAGEVVYRDGYYILDRVWPGARPVSPRALASAGAKSRSPRLAAKRAARRLLSLRLLRVRVEEVDDLRHLVDDVDVVAAGNFDVLV